jgi:preprotein translocase subunit SecE
MNPAEKVKDWVQRSRQFYTDVRGEMKKVSWPPRHEVVGTTIVVVIAVFFFGFYLGIVDYFLARGLNRLLTYFSGTGG